MDSFSGRNIVETNDLLGSTVRRLEEVGSSEKRAMAWLRIARAAKTRLNLQIEVVREAVGSLEKNPERTEATRFSDSLKRLARTVKLSLEDFQKVK